MQSENAGACRNCGGCDFAVDYACGECCCEGCGCVDSRLMVASASFKQTFDLNGTRVEQAPLVEMFSSAAFSTTAADELLAERLRATASAPYKRRTYFSERLSQWQSREPAIDRVDFEEIRTLYQEYNGGKHQAWKTMAVDNPWRKVPIWSLDRAFSKEDCRTLLWEIDRRRVALKQRAYFVVSLIFFCNQNPLHLLDRVLGKRRYPFNTLEIIGEFRSFECVDAAKPKINYDPPHITEEISREISHNSPFTRRQQQFGCASERRVYRGRQVVV